MTANMQDVCEYEGRLYVVRSRNRFLSEKHPDMAWWMPTRERIDSILEAQASVPKPQITNSACWRGYVGYFVVEDGALFIRALSAYGPKGEVPESDEWAVRRGDERLWDWSLCGPFMDNFLEYTFTRPREVPLECLRFYDNWRAKAGEFVREVSFLAG